MIKFTQLLAVSFTAALAANASAEGVTSISFEGKITQPTCIIKMEQAAITLPTVATTAFKPVGDLKVAGSQAFSVSLVQDAANEAAAGEFCPSVSYATSETGKTVPNFKISTTASTSAGYLKNTKDSRAEAEHTVAIQILNGSQALDLSKAVVIEAKDEDKGVLNFTARYVALNDEAVDVQLVAAALNVSVDYK